MTPSQRRRLLDNLTQWRRDRLIIAGHKPPGSLDSDVLTSLHLQRLLFGVAVAEITWTTRQKTADELRWELFPKPGVVAVPTIRCR